MRSISLFVVALAAPLAAQQFVAELDGGAAAPFAPAPRHAAAGTGVVYFTADSPEHGRELHVTNGTPLGTRVFADLVPGPLGSNARAIGAVGASVVVQVGTVLRITDGTPAGTQTIATGVDETSEFRWLGPIGSRFVWAARQTTWQSGFSLFGSDGTLAGTVFLGNVSALTGSVVRGNRLLVLGATNSTQVYSTDGLTITPIATLTAGPRSGFATLGAHDYFLLDDQFLITSLWRTDGTAAGTTVVANLGPSQGLGSVEALGSQLVIGAANQLWTSNGTSAGTVSYTSSVVQPNSLTPAGGVLLFTNGGPVTGGAQLWRTDGTAAGTFVVDGTPGFYTSFAVGTSRTFCLVGDATPLRLLRTDGTVAGTVSMPLVDMTGDTSFVTLGNDAIATTTLGTPASNTGLHAFRTDATAAGSVQLTASTTPAGIVQAEKGAAVGSTLFFAAATAATGNELWRTDGTASGTQLVQDFAPGPANGVTNVLSYAGAAWIAAGNGIWRHDGGPGPSVLALQPDPAATGSKLLLAKGGYLLFQTSTTFSTKLWRSDGTPLGTVLLDEALFFQVITGVAQVGEATFWTRLDLSNGRLLRSDGTPSGRVDFSPALAWLGVLDDRVLFVRTVPGSYELYSVTETGLAPQFVGTVPFAPVASYAIGSKLVCLSNSGSTFAGTAFATDGIATVTPLPLPSVTSPHFVADGFVYTGAFDAATGTSLWRTDGTVAGTGPAISFGSSGLGSVRTAEALGSGNRIFLGASDGVTGDEVWVSQGTQATTALFADVEPNGNSSPQLIGVAGERAYFVAFDAVRGRELWSFDLAAVGAANAQPFGAGCPGTLGVPQLHVDGIGAIGRAVSLRLERGAPSSLGLWFVGLGPQRLAIGGGCEFLMTTVAWSDWALTDAVGSAATSLLVPNDPVFVGVPVVAQAACIDPLGPSSFGTSGTQGVLLVLGG